MKNKGNKESVFAIEGVTIDADITRQDIVEIIAQDKINSIRKISNGLEQELKDVVEEVEKVSNSKLKEKDLLKYFEDNYKDLLSGLAKSYNVKKSDLKIVIQVARMACNSTYLANSMCGSHYGNGTNKEFRMDDIFKGRVMDMTGLNFVADISIDGENTISAIRFEYDLSNPKKAVDKNFKKMFDLSVKRSTLAHNIQELHKAVDNIKYKKEDMKVDITKNILAQSKNGSDLLKSIEKMKDNVDFGFNENVTKLLR